MCGETTEVCGPETWAQYEADLGAIFEEIFALRGGEPVILRTFDWWIPWGPLETWRACDREQPCKRCWVQFSDAIHRAAAAHAVPVAGLLVAFSGADLALDMPREYCSDDVHPSARRRRGHRRRAGIAGLRPRRPVTGGPLCDTGAGGQSGSPHRSGRRDRGDPAMSVLEIAPLWCLLGRTGEVGGAHPASGHDAGRRL